VTKKIVLSLAALILMLTPLTGSAVTATTPIWIQFVTATQVDPNGVVPAFNKVAGAGVTNLDLGQPASILNHGTAYVYVLSLQDLNFTGTCQASFKLTQKQGTTVVTLDSGTNATFSCAPSGANGGEWAWATNGKAIPNSPGLATLTGTVKYGTKTVSLATTVLLQ